MISAVFRRGGDVTFVVDELKAIFDPQGGQWMNGRYVPSLLAAIGEVIEQHMLRIGFLAARTPAPAPLMHATGDGSPRDPPGNSTGAAVSASPHSGAKRCPRCGHGALVLEGGCWICLDCGHTRCG